MTITQRGEITSAFGQAVLVATLILAVNACRNEAEIEKREYRALKDHLMAMSRVPTEELGPEIEILEQMEITSERVDAARDLCASAHSDVLEAHEKHKEVQKGLDELTKIIEEGTDDLDEEELQKTLELVDDTKKNLEESSKLIEQAAEGVASCFDTLDELEAEGVGRNR